MAHEQFVLPIKAEKTAYNKSSGPKLNILNEGDEVKVVSSKVHFVFNKKSGIVSSYKVNGKEYFEQGFGIQPNFWRAPNDNDYGSVNPKRLEIWEISSRDFNVSEASATMEGDKALVKITYKLPAKNDFIINYKIYPDGIVNVSTQFMPTYLEIGRASCRERV